MLRTKLNGQEGYFLTLKEKEQIEQTLKTCSEVCKKVVMENAINSWLQHQPRI